MQAQQVLWLKTTMSLINSIYLQYIEPSFDELDEEYSDELYEEYSDELDEEYSDELD